MKTLLSALAFSCVALSATAQTATEPQFKTGCDDGKWTRGGSESKRFCEIRDLTMAVPAGQPLTISGGANGGITVHGWSGAEVRVRAKVQSWASSEAEARKRVQEVSIEAANNRLQASAAGSEERHSVSYEVFVPQQTALVLNTVNGGISLDNLQADVQFSVVNGGVSLANLGGSVTGKTVNGGLDITLSGKQWDGKGLDVETTNGGITWNLPKGYSAQLETSTNMGSIRASMPVNKSGMMRKELVTSLGNGGAPVKAVTVNGGIRVNQERE
ncbi:DUF4097 family beta strand repeat-containing protein [Hymenobacter glacialis]|uniref:DUF4097 domain-containing protein n=1 Tax=Hymenobacter glacialis TaxID=1908236 RepID=A0A1G1TCD8_9BACT|nr:DUF4097 family beta strand repeat-containing protein [Hymenobacter glacialis]OGX88547.1 hypothetical protein BEN48_09170 [Hymenobacter glacialis]